MMTAKVFENGRSQAVRLPKEYRFSDEEVAINKIGDIVILRNCREIICIFLESMLIYVMNEFSDSGGHFHGT